MLTKHNEKYDDQAKELKFGPTGKNKSEIWLRRFSSKADCRVVPNGPISIVR